MLSLLSVFFLFDTVVTKVDAVALEPFLRGVVHPVQKHTARHAATVIEVSVAAAKEATEALIAERAQEGELAEITEPAHLAQWHKHAGKSCQGYIDTTQRSLNDSKVECGANHLCAGVVCAEGQAKSCTLRKMANFVPYPEEDCYTQVDDYELHPSVNELIGRNLCFRGVMTQRGQRVNILIAQRPPDDLELELYDKHKADILFLGISSFEDYPLFSGNPFSTAFNEDKYVGLFPGWLHMMKQPQQYFPSNVSTILMSQSDFDLPDYPARDYLVPKKYDFTLSGSDQDVANDCVGWSSFAKNWSFVKEALHVMCREYQLTGVLVATKSKDGKMACTIPESCKGKITQTMFLSQDKYHNYLKQSRFAFLPQVHDASPRVATEALSSDVPLLLNAHISGGWKYLNEKTGEFFTDMSDFRRALDKILHGADVENHYEPRKWIREYYGNENSGKRLLKFVKDNFADRVSLPKGTKWLTTQSDR